MQPTGCQPIYIMDQKECDIVEDATGFEALYKSMNKCKCGVMWKTSVANYCLHDLERTLKLEEDLKEGKYKPGEPMTFMVTHPKPRQILSIGFRDRVYQRSLNDEIVYPALTKSLIYDNAACQKDKGTDFARERLKKFLHRFYRKHGQKGHVLQMDIKGYYPNMQHDVAKKKFRKHLDDWTYDCACRILDQQYAGEVGFNPGSQIIQIAGIAVLDEIDHYIKERLRVKLYIRYMDDMIVIAEDREYLERCREAVAGELAKMGFRLHETKTRIYPLKDGIKFLGFYFRLTDTGKVLQILDPEKIKAERKKLRRLIHRAKRGIIGPEKVYQCLESWEAHAKKGNNFKVIQKMRKFARETWKEDLNVDGTGQDRQTYPGEES